MGFRLMLSIINWESRISLDRPWLFTSLEHLYWLMMTEFKGTTISPGRQCLPLCVRFSLVERPTTMSNIARNGCCHDVHHMSRCHPVDAQVPKVHVELPNYSHTKAVQSEHMELESSRTPECKRSCLALSKHNFM